MGMEHKLEDIHLGLKVPLCECCRHVLHHVRDREHPRSMTCSLLGNIPEELYTCQTYRCEAFEVDRGSYSVYKPFLPSDLNLD